MVAVEDFRSIESQYSGSKMLVFYSLLLVITVLWLIHLWQKQSRLYQLGNKLPGPTHVPIFGNALLFLTMKPEDVYNIALGYYRKFGDVSRGWLGYKLYVFLSDAADVEVILNSSVHINKSDEYKFFKPWLGEGLLISTGRKWKSHRKIIAPTFHINILKSFIPVFNENSKNVVKRLKSEMEKTIDVHDYMSETTVDILLETAMGITRDTQDGSGFDYAMAVMKMCEILHIRQYRFYLRSDFIFRFSSYCKKQLNLLNIIHGLTNKVIKIKKNAYFKNNTKSSESPVALPQTGGNTGLAKTSKTLADNVFKGYRDDLDDNDENDIGEKKRLAFLDLLIDSNQNGKNTISDTEIKEEVDTIMFEGHDTTAAGSSFVLCLLGVHQNHQAKVYDELYDIFGDSDRPATFEDTLKMKYLERVILESLRIFPPVPVIARQIEEDVQISTNNSVIPAGATVVIIQYLLHRNPKYYKDPDVFNPDNFLPENCQNRHYYSFIPFSAGPRSCVGRKYALLKLKVLLSTILRNFRVSSDVTEDEFKLKFDIILKRVDGFRLKMHHRERVPSSNLTNN